MSSSAAASSTTGDKWLLAPIHSPDTHIGKKPGIVAQLEALRQSNAKWEKSRHVQPNLQEQKLMITKAFAKKFVKNNIAYELDVLKDKIATGDTRLLQRLRSSKSGNRPFTVGGDGSDSANFQGVDGFDNKGDSSDKKGRPSTSAPRGKHGSKGSGSGGASSFEDDLNALKAQKNIKQPVLEELNFSSIFFESIVTRNKSFQHQKVFRNAPPMEIEVERPRDIIIEDQKSVPKKQKVGMAILIDPSLNTNGKDVILKVTYDVLHSEPVPGASSGFLAKQEKPTRHVVNYSLRSDGKVYGLKITQSPVAPFPGELLQGPQIIHNLSQEKAATITEEDMKINPSTPRVIPGWQGMAPIFIPYHIAKLELLEATELPLNSISFGIFMCQNLKPYYKNVNSYVVSFTLTRASNKTLDGGIPSIHIAAWKGDMAQLNLLLIQGANIDGRSRENRTTVLHDAISGAQDKIVMNLLLRGANQMIGDDSGNLPLHLACQLGNITIAIILMKGPGGKKALQVCNKKGFRPLDLCKSEFLKQRVEDFMRAYLIVIKQRVSIIDA